MRERRAPNILRPWRRPPASTTFSKLYLALLGQFPVEISADDTGGNDPAANVGAISHLQNVVLEPRHVGASRHYQSFSKPTRELPGEKTAA